MVSAIPTTRELIAKVGPRRVTPPMLSAATWLLGASACLCLLTISFGGLVMLQPSLKDNLLPAARVIYAVGIILFVGWGTLNVAAFVHLLWRSNDLLAEQLDAQMTQDQELIDSLVRYNTLSDLQRLRRRIAFEAQMSERFGTTVAVVGGLGAAITTAAVALPIGTWQLRETLKITVPAFLLGTAIAGALRHGFGQRLLRLGFAISEAECVHATGEGVSRRVQTYRDGTAFRQPAIFCKHRQQSGRF